MKYCQRSVIATVALIAIFCSVSQAQVGKRLPGMLEANTATEAELAAVPNLTAAIAKDLVAKRPFLSAADLNKHLTDEAKLTAEQLTTTYGKLFLQLNLNTATDAEIRLIPNLGNRMLREFKEYRPYKTMAQFRREMGKYVNEAEVARLEQYVFVPLNLNTASDEDLMTIPGLGNRMLREFKEYRPYKTIEQFRKEIGKYVNEKEVARLERYITIEQ